MPKFVVKDMETLFIDEVRQSINLLISNLESVPVTPRGQTLTGRKKENKSRSRYASCFHLPVAAGERLSVILIPSRRIRLSFQICIRHQKVPRPAEPLTNSVRSLSFEGPNCPFSLPSAATSLPLLDSFSSQSNVSPLAHGATLLTLFT